MREWIFYGEKGAPSVPTVCGGGAQIAKRTRRQWKGLKVINSPALMESE